MTPSRHIIAVTGHRGQLGHEIALAAKRYPQHHFIFLDRAALDLEDETAIGKWFAAHQPTHFINCAAYTAVDKAESDRDTAYRVNTVAPGLLAAQCHKNNCRFIHISTDYVFDGRSARPYRETDEVAPATVYGSTKAEGEKRVLEADPGAVIIRTSWVYSSVGKNFLLTMLRLFAEKESVNVVADQAGTPTNAADLADAILQIIDQENWKPGIYHYSNEGLASWYEFAKEIARQVQSNCVVNPITTDQFPTPARRPAYSVMDKEKIRSTFNLVIPTWQESLAACLGQIKKARQ